MRYLSIFSGCLCLFVIMTNSSCNNIKDTKNSDLNHLINLLSTNKLSEHLAIVVKHKKTVMKITSDTIEVMFNDLEAESCTQRRESYIYLLCLRSDQWKPQRSRYLNQLYADSKISSKEFSKFIKCLPTPILATIEQRNINNLINDFIIKEKTMDIDSVLITLFDIGKKLDNFKTPVNRLARFIVQNSKQFNGFQNDEARIYLGLNRRLEDTLK